VKNCVTLILKGMVIGIANIIPGVSGGTMALLLGIYDRLIRAIGRFSPRTLTDLWRTWKGRRGGSSSWRRFCEEYDLGFLLFLAVGAGAAIVTMSRLLKYLLMAHHDPTFGLFFGLVAASVLVPCSLMKRKSWPELLTAVVAVGLTIGLSELKSPEERFEAEQEKISLQENAAEQEDASGGQGLSVREFGSLFLVGAVAISAMILPGVSGSFVLLLFGVYLDILSAIIHLDVRVLGAFGLGCAVGIILFARLLNFLLERYYSPTMAFLAGLMVGSLWGLWPFKEVRYIGASQKPIYLANLWPDRFQGNEWLTLTTTIIGIALVAAFLRYEKTSTAE